MTSTTFRPVAETKASNEPSAINNALDPSGAVNTRTPASIVSRKGRGAGRNVSPIHRASACAAPTSANVPSARAVRMRHIDAPSAVRRHLTPPGAVKSTDFIASAHTAAVASRP